MATLTWILGIIGTLGVAGAITAVILAPAVAMPILTKITKAFLGCRLCLVALALIATNLGSYWYGHHAEALNCRADALAAELATKQADLDHAKEAAADEAQRASTIEATANDQHKKDLDYIKALTARPACAFDDDDAGVGVRP